VGFRASLDVMVKRKSLPSLEIEPQLSCPELDTLLCEQSHLVIRNGLKNLSNLALKEFYL
jgi:hypothetical protein